MWSAVYSFNTLTVTAGYPSFFGFSLSIGSLYYLYGYLYLDKRKDLLLSIILFYLFFITYPPMLLFYLINAIFIVSKWGSQVEDNRGVNGGGVPRQSPQAGYFNRAALEKMKILIPLFSLTVLASFLWPFFSLKSALIGAGYSKDIPFRPMVRLGQLWPAIPGCLALFLLPDNRLRKYCRYGSIVFISLALISLPLTIDLWGRFLLFWFFGLQIAYSAYIVNGNSGLTSPPGRLFKKGLVVVFFLVCAYQMTVVYQGNKLKLKVPMASYRKVGSLLGDRAVVLSDPVTGWPLPAFGPKIIAPIYLINEIDGESERQYDVLSFMAFPQKTSRGKEILSKYQAGYILINNKTRNYERFTRFGEVIYSDDFLVLIRVVNKGNGSE